MSKFFNLSEKKPTVFGQPGNGHSSLDVDELVKGSRELESQPKEPPVSPSDTNKSVHLNMNLPVLCEKDGKVGSHAALEAYRSLRTRLLRLQATKNIRSVAVTSAEPGEGKTLSTINLGICYAQLFDTKVLLVDGDLRSQAASSLLSCSGFPGVGEVLEGKVSFADAIISTSIKNLFVVCAGQSSLPASELYATSRWRDFMEWCMQTFKLVLVDSTPVLGLADFELMAAASDGVLVVVRARTTKREVLQDAVRQLDQKKVLGIIFNGQEDPRKQYYGYYTRKK